jgi:membrane peptidoglycan carboxypeptidase
VRTNSGKTLKLHQSLSDRIRARKHARATRRAAYLSTLPKEPWKRLLYRFEPHRLARYWFSREGGIMALKVAGIGIVVCFFLVVGVFAYFRKDLPQIKDLSGEKIGGSITYYDRTGATVLWQDYSGVKRIPVASDQISKYMKDATVAIEDKNFYHEGAFDVRGIMRAGFNDLTGGSTQGGSTITQQLVKLNEDWGNDHTIARKVKELILAVELEREYSKDDILTGYLNVAPYGGVEYGVESAARDYFGVDASQLTIAQAAMLAAIPKSPTTYSPYSDPQYNPADTEDLFDKQALIGRQQYVIDQMVKQHLITQAQGDAAKKEDVLAQIHPLQSLYNGIKAPYFVLAAKQQLNEKYGAETVNRGGWKVITTLDMNLQNTAEDLIAKNLPSIQRLTGGAADEEATVAEDVQTGQIVALVGGTDFSNPDHGQNNYAAGILIPPGSSFKPYDYTTLINNNNNVGAGSVIYDSQGPLPGYPCTNKALPKNGGNCLEDYDFIYPGPLTLRYALGGSRNVPAVKAMLMAVPNDTSNGRVASINKVISTASSMMDNPYIKGSTYNCYSDEQLTKTTQCYGASAIGDGAFLHLDDHVNGLSTLARLGTAIPKTYILKVTDASGKVIDQFKQPKGTQVVRPDAAYIVDNMLSDPNASYLPSAYKFQHYNGSQFAVKTGTTNDGFDGLMTSWSSKYAVVSWVGNHMRNKDLSAAHGAAMETLTEPITRGMMEAAQNGKPPSTWTQPSDIKVLPAFVVRNHIHYGDVEPSPSTDLFPSWYQGKTGASTSQTIDKVSGKVATSCTPDLAKQVVGGANDNAFSIDIFVNGGLNHNSSSSASNATDDVHNCNDSPPAVSLTVKSTKASGASDTCDPSCTITVTVSQGTHPLSGGSYTSAPASSVTLTLDGQTINTQAIPSDQSNLYSYSFTYTATSSSGGNLQATAADSVLYQGTASDTLTLTPSTQQNGNGNNPGNH